MSRWDKGLDYEATYQRIVYHLRRSYSLAQKSTQKQNKRRVPAFCYDAILLIQLKNASRISEAVRAFREYLATRKTELEVQVSKKRKKEARKMVLPPEILELDCNMCLGLLDRPETLVTDVAKHYARKKYGFNTHSLRYARITHLLRQGVDSAVIAKITHHSNVNFIRTYTQQKLADEILRNME
ncbi:MAG: tyrosine-type recombinase/integrase [Thermofilum sp.]|jgi:integrase|uniref:tyrosine-type recombinase/integrase n=1 Tax=Thermofilum sp. TaxID=1961369 RepID=UPI002584125D|nr:tyrosine-type recombinase/integrase [Thermofilum sp.]MCI4408661.1 tyrosine-type recombinase/integrase [Thermofilum sp.]